MICKHNEQTMKDSKCVLNKEFLVWKYIMLIFSEKSKTTIMSNISSVILYQSSKH